MYIGRSMNTGRSTYTGTTCCLSISTWLVAVCVVVPTGPFCTMAVASTTHGGCAFVVDADDVGDAVGSLAVSPEGIVWLITPCGWEGGVDGPTTCLRDTSGL